MGTLRAIVTTIHPPTPAMRELANRIAAAGGRLIVAGDARGPSAYDLPSTELLSLPSQLSSSFSLARLLPLHNYARKNIAYLTAMAQGASPIYETDDDNAPLPEWTERSIDVEAESVSSRPWVNVYRLFSDALVWPRGFPLGRIRDPSTWAHASTGVLERGRAPIQEGLHDGDPDADAIWRLALYADDLRFARRPSVRVPAHCWAPFNSQSTWWWPEAYPLLYIPVHCPARMPDIWRGYVASRCLWAAGREVVFHGPEVHQRRNPHDLMRDFEDEVDGYLGVERLTAALDSLDLPSGADAIADNMYRCYERLIELELVGERERALLQSWLADVAEVWD